MWFHGLNPYELKDYAVKRFCLFHLDYRDLEEDHGKRLHAEDEDNIPDFAEDDPWWGEDRDDLDENSSTDTSDSAFAWLAHDGWGNNGGVIEMNGVHF